MPVRRPPLCAVALVVALPLVAACKTESDPRKGGFVSGVTNLATGGYDTFVQEKRDELEANEAESQTLEARARAIEVEREALDRDIDEAARKLGSLRERLAFLRDKLAATEQTTTGERRKLEEAREQAEAAQDRLGALRRGETQSIEAKRQGVGDLKDLIASVALMVDDLSK